MSKFKPNESEKYGDYEPIHLVHWGSDLGLPFNIIVVQSPCGTFWAFRINCKHRDMLARIHDGRQDMAVVD